MTEAERADLMAQLRDKNAELAALQDENPLILPIVDAQAVASVVGDWTGIPVGRMVRRPDRHRAPSRKAPRQARDRAGSRHG
jgi:ATP-dependent Clp protease ATP-binding subunit ClpA